MKIHLEDLSMYFRSEDAGGGKEVSGFDDDSDDGGDTDDKEHCWVLIFSNSCNSKFWQL